jgi:hypothetical protein
MHCMHLQGDLNVIVWGSTTVINVIPLKKMISKILEFYKFDRMIAMWPKWWKYKPKNEKV